MSNLVQFPSQPNTNAHSEVLLDEGHKAALFFMRPHPRPCFTTRLLDELNSFKKEVTDRVEGNNRGEREPDIRYAVVASGLTDAFNFGGDLNLFVNMIRDGDREGLRRYAHDCVRVAHDFNVGFDLPVTTIALVEGRAQGGGFEAALACNVLIAERGTHLGFPEVLFNLFPGMGAYSFLSRRIAPALAERLILSGKLYSAEELYEMGVVDVLADPGEGRRALKEYIQDAERRPHVRSLLRHIRRTYQPVPLEELQDITEFWVDSALGLGERDLRTMERLVRAQDRRTGQELSRAE